MHDGIGHMVHPLDGEPPRMENPPSPLGQCAVGTHPTGMHSCLLWHSSVLVQVNSKIVTYILHSL